jgi:hypothetical protein
MIINLDVDFWITKSRLSINWACLALRRVLSRARHMRWAESKVRMLLEVLNLFKNYCVLYEQKRDAASTCVLVVRDEVQKKHVRLQQKDLLNAAKFWAQQCTIAGC